MAASDPIEAIRFRTQRRGMVRRDFGPISVSDALASLVVIGKRELILRIIRALHAHLGHSRRVSDQRWQRSTGISATGTENCSSTIFSFVNEIMVEMTSAGERPTNGQEALIPPEI